MIYGYFHQGSGLGNQLHRYVATRVLAQDKGYDFGMYQPELFKGASFMELDMGKPIEDTEFAQWREKEIRENGVDIRSYDPEINFVKDWTGIDGELQDEKYFNHRLVDVRDWLGVEPLEMPDNVCIIGFRGGEYALFPELFLTKDYWDEAIFLMRMQYAAKYGDVTFQVHTDDPITAKKFFPEYECIQDISLNWRSVRYAKHLIIANSSFYIFPALLNENVQEVIAPKYWARRNTKTWALPQNYYSDKRWMYI